MVRPAGRRRCQFLHVDLPEFANHPGRALSAGGAPEAQQCGWLADKFGLSWQLVPAELGTWFDNPDATSRVMVEVMRSKKLDIAALRRAVAG